MRGVSTPDDSGELRVSFLQLIVDPDPTSENDYRDNYVRRMSGPVLLAHGEPEEKTHIGEVELIYFAGSLAVENGLDIVDVSNSEGQDEYEYTRSVYADGGVLDRKIVGEAMSNDLLAVHAVSLHPGHQKESYRLRLLRKIAETVGYHCGAVIVSFSHTDSSGEEPDVIAESEPLYGVPFELRPMKNPSIWAVSV
jgi:hypothetical protein